MGFLRAVLLFKLGFWAGMVTSAAIVKRAFPSRGDEDSDELRLVAIQNGIELKSRARAFRGGSMLAWLGGIAVDLRTPEELRASFTNYWNQRLCLDLSALNAWERSEVELSIKLAHLTRISELSEELKAQPRTWELQFVANELVRGAQATAE